MAVTVGLARAEVPDTTPVKVAYSFVEYKAVFAEPIFAAFAKKDWGVIRGLYLALQKYGLSLEQIVVRQHTSNISEIQITFNLPAVRLTAHLTLGSLVISVVNPDWSRAAELAEIVSAAVEATKVSADAVLQTQQVSLGMHLISEGKTPRELNARFLAMDGKAPEFLGKIRGSGFSIYGEETAVVVDASGLYAEALFVKITRNHLGSAALPTIAEMLDRDETQTFAFLGLHENA